jgi:peptidoglycan/LPS O-acetylase OafA/YrhL
VYFLFVQGFPTGDGWLSLAKQLVIPSSGYHLWFVVMIFQFYLLFPVFVYMAKRIVPKLIVVKEERVVNRVPAFVIVMAVAFGGLLWVSYNVLPAWYYSSAPEWLKPFIAHRNLNFVFYSFYFVLGGVVALGLDSWRKFIIRIFAWSAVVFTGMYIWLGYDVLSFSIEHINLNVSTYLKPTTFIIIIAQMLLLYRMALLIIDNGGFFLKLLRFIGTYSFGGFLIHPLIISMLSVVTRPMHLTGNHLWVTIVFYAAVVGISIGSAHVLSKLPFGWMLVGTTGRKPSGQRPSKGISA